jgi:hypothetical protein
MPGKNVEQLARLHRPDVYLKRVLTASADNLATRVKRQARKLTKEKGV